MEQTATRVNWLIVCICLLTALTPDWSFGDDQATRDRRHRQLLEQRQAILKSLEQDLESVVRWCDDHSLSEAARSVSRVAAEILKPDQAIDPPRFVTPAVDPTLPPEEQQWQLQLRHHRKERGGELYKLARGSLSAGFPSMAFSMVRDVVRIDPDHKYARAILGKQIYADPLRKEDRSYAGEWVTAFEKQMRQKGNIEHQQFGWIPQASVTKYEAGQRPWNNSWIGADTEAERRRDFRNAWEIRSEHFLVKTNVSLEAGLSLSRNLEIFHEWLYENFAAFFDTPKALKERFDKAVSSSRKTQAPMEVHFFSTRQEYERRLEGKLPPNLVTEGVYWNDDETSYFFANDGQASLSTLFHEATHQILDLATRQERRIAAGARARRQNRPATDGFGVCQNSNFWIVEGIASYFESFEIHDGTISVGNPNFVRFETARHRMLDPQKHFYLPARKFCEMGKDAFQVHPNLGQLYTQAAGFTHFLMHYEDGLYRDDLIALLSAVYRPDARATAEPSLSEIAGVPFADFDHHYQVHMQNLEDLSRQGP